MTTDQQIRLTIHHHFQQIDYTLHALLDYLNPTNPDFDTDAAISRWERFNSLQQRHTLSIASSLVDLTELRVGGTPSPPDGTSVPTPLG